MNRLVRMLICCAVTSVAVCVVEAQQNAVKQLSLQECVETALSANYNIKIQKGLRQVAENNVTPAPFLPTVTAGASQNSAYTDVREAPKDAEVVKREYTNNQYTADLSLNWRLFDGLAMFADYDVKKELMREGELKLRAKVENLVADISDQYFYLVTQQGRLEAAKKYLEISIIRYNQAREKYNIGSISGLEMKQAKIDLNADSSKLVLQQQVISNGYIRLFEMMNVPLDSEVELKDRIVPDGELMFDVLAASARTNNTSILLAKSGQAVSALDLKLAKSSRYPTLDFGARYKFDRSARDDSGLRYSNQYGPNWGFTLSMKIFDRMETSRKIRNAKIDVENSVYLVQQVQLEVESSVAQLYNIYRKNFTMIWFETESAEAAMDNLDAAMDMYRLGSLSGVEFREIQRSYLEAEERKLDAIFQAKSSEIALLLLAGSL